MSDKAPELSILAENITVQYRHSDYRYQSLKEYVIERMKGRIKHRTVLALDQVGIQVAKGESIALIGHNGSGKSTLLRVLAGVIEPRRARIEIQGRVAPMIELGTGFDGELSGYENIVLSCSLMGLKASEIYARIDDIIAFSELRPYINMPFKNYSSGMQARLGFSCTTAVDPDILLVDEVLAVGDSNFARKCLQRIQALRSQGTTVVLVSHDPTVVRSFCDRAYVLEEGRIVFEGKVEDSLKVHDEIMERRYIANLSEKAAAEYLHDRRPEGMGYLQLPQVKVKYSAFQDGHTTRSIDLAKPFTLRFNLEITEADLFRDRITAGVGLNTPDGQRVSGVNNTHINLQLTSILKNNGKVELDFKFAEGIRHLAAGVYQVVFGLHDDNLIRTIFCYEVGHIEASNSVLGMNVDHDICDISRALSAIDVRGEIPDARAARWE